MNEKEADIKKAILKPHIVFGLVMIMLGSLMYGETSDHLVKFSYKFHIPGMIDPFTPPPRGFTRAYQQPYSPVSVNFPDWFKEVKIHQSATDSGDVLIMTEKIGDHDIFSPRYVPFSEYYILKKSYDLDHMWFNRVAMTDSLFFLNPLEQQQSSSQSLEIIGADIAGQRVALRIRGLISITGKYNQQNNSIHTTGTTENEKKNF